MTRLVKRSARYFSSPRSLGSHGWRPRTVLRRRRRTRIGSGRSGAGRTRPASRVWPIRRSSGASPRTSDGRLVIPGRGSASPVVWGDRIFVLTAVPVGLRATPSTRRAAASRHAASIGSPCSRSIAPTGKTVWERVAREQEPHEASHTDNGTWASSSAITDGERVYAYFESFGLYVYDMNGKPDLGEGSRRQAHAQRVRRGLDARAPRQHARGRLGSPQRRRLVRRRARQARRQGAVAREARRDRHLGDAARPRGQRPRPGHRPGHGAHPQLRPRRPAPSCGKAKG